MHRTMSYEASRIVVIGLFETEKLKRNKVSLIPKQAKVSQT